MRSVRLAVPNYGRSEIDAVLEALESGNVTQGELVATFERDFLGVVGATADTSAAMVNSGSSANLLAAAFWAWLLEQQTTHAKPWEVIMPAVTWSTTVAPFLQHGFTPVFVDVGPDYCLDPAQLEAAVTPNTVGVVAVHLLGNPCNMEAVMGVAKRHDLLVHEDCCEALGAYWGDHQVGTFGTTASYSFYLSHHVTTIEGGILLYPASAYPVLAMREHGWTRKYPTTIKAHLARDHPTLHPTWTFDQLGYNVRATELQAAIGLKQLTRHPAWRKARLDYAAEYDRGLRRYDQYLHPRTVMPNGICNPFNYPIRVRATAPFKRHALLDLLERAGVETRPVMSGNITRHPWYRRHPDAYRVHGTLTQTNEIHDNAFLLPCGPHLGVDDVQYVVRATAAFLEGCA